MYLLYQNVEPVREAFNKAWKVISSGATAVYESIKTFIVPAIEGIGKLLTLDFSGAMESFGNVGEGAADAFNDKFASEIAAANFEDEGKKLTESLEKGMEVKVRIDKEESFKEYLSSYEDLQTKISVLQSKNTKEGLTSDEQKELKQLETQAQQTAASIGNIAPETRQNFKTVVDSMGNLKQVYDININKAKEFANANKSGSELAEQAKIYSKSLEEQVRIIDKQKDHLDDLKTRINKANDPEIKQKLIDKYQEEISAVNANKQALVDSFEKGGKAGLLTEKAISKIAKQLNITSDEAKKMLLAKELEEISKKGEISQETLDKLADKYGVARTKATEIKNEQQKITEETKKTDAAAKNWGDTLSSIGSLQKEAKEKALKAQLDYNKGIIDEAEYTKQVNEAQKQLKVANDEAKIVNQSIHDLKKSGIDLTAVEIKQEEKKAKVKKESKESEYAIAKKRFELNNQIAEEANKEAKLDEELAILKLGRLKTEIEVQEDKVEEVTKASVEAERQLKAYQELYSIAKKQYDIESRKGKVSANTKKDYEEAQKVVAEYSNKLKEAQLVELKTKVQLKLDEDQARKEAEKIYQQMEKTELEYKISIGLKAESDKLKYDLNTVESQITTLTEELNTEIALGAKSDPKRIAELKIELQNLELELVQISSDLKKKLREEDIKSINDFAERERQLALFNAEKIFEDRLNQARGNYALEFQAFEELQLAKEEADKKYLLNTSRLYRNTSIFTSALQFDFSQSNSETEAIQEKDDQLKASLSNFEKERDALRDQLKSKEISVKDYYKNLEKLQAEHNKESEKLAKEKADLEAKSSNNVGKAIAKALEESSKQSLAAAKASSKKLIALTSRQSKTDQRLKSKQSQIESAIAKKDFKLKSTLEEDLAKLKQEEHDLEIARVEEKSEMYADFGVTTGTMFASMIANGESFQKAFAKTAISALKSLVPVYIAEITAKAFAQNPILGAVIAAGATATVLGLVSVAESSLGFRKGGKVPGGQKRITINEEGEEFVMNDKSTSTNEADYEVLNRTNLPLKDYIFKYRTDITKEISHQAVFESDELVQLQKNVIVQSLVNDRDKEVISELREQNRILKEENAKTRDLLKENIKETKRLKGYIKTRINVQVSGTMTADNRSVTGTIDKSKQAALRRM